MPGFFLGGKGGPANSIRAEFHRSHRWIIEDLGAPTGAGPLGSATRGNAPLAPKIYAQSVQLPALSFEEEKVKSASLTYKIAKAAKYSNVVVKFYDLWGLYKIFKDWQDLIWTPDDGIKKAQDYKGIVILNLTDGQGSHKQTYKMMGAYPVNITHGELSYVNSEIKILTVTYSFDYAEIELNDELGNQ